MRIVIAKERSNKEVDFWKRVIGMRRERKKIGENPVLS